jgi:hypothetical protein
MHQLSYALVPASTDDDALTNARHVFDRLVDTTSHDPTGFDEYWLFTDDHTTEFTTRWDDLPAVVRLDSERGQQLLDRAGKPHNEPSSAISRRLETASTPSQSNRSSKIQRPFGSTACGLDSRQGPASFSTIRTATASVTARS